MAKKKTPKQMERHLKGISNHYRIEILLLLGERGGLTVIDTANKLKANIKTISEHLHRLVRAGLVNKNRDGNFVKHELSPYGKIFTDFLKKIQNL